MKSVSSFRSIDTATTRYTKASGIKNLSINFCNRYFVFHFNVFKEEHVRQKILICCTKDYSVDKFNKWSKNIYNTISQGLIHRMHIVLHIVQECFTRTRTSQLPMKD